MEICILETVLPLITSVGNRRFGGYRNGYQTWILSFGLQPRHMTNGCNLSFPAYLACVPVFCVPANSCERCLRSMDLRTNYVANCAAALTCLSMATTLATALLSVVRLEPRPAAPKSSQPAHALELGYQIAKKVFEGLRGVR